MRLHYNTATGVITKAVKQSDIIFDPPENGESEYEIDECPENAALCRELLWVFPLRDVNGAGKYSIVSGALNVVDNWQQKPPTIPIINFIGGE